MNPFSGMMNDKFYIIHKDNRKTGPYKTAFSPTKEIIVFGSSMEIDEDCQIVRPLPNGKEELFDVEEANFITGMHGIPSHYSIKLQKANSKPKPKTYASTTINISNSSAFQVGDHNTQNITDSLNELIQRINSSDSSEYEKQEAKKGVKNLLENPTIAAILGGTVSSLFTML